MMQLVLFFNIIPGFFHLFFMHTLSQEIFLNFDRINQIMIYQNGVLLLSTYSMKKEIIETINKSLGGRYTLTKLRTRQ